MSAAIIIDAREIKQIQSRTINPSRFVSLGQTIHRLAETIKREWNNFSQEDRSALKSLAYDLLESPKGINGVWLSIWARAYMVYIKLTNQQQALYFCLDALDVLIDTILDAVERDDAGYQQVLLDTLKEINSNPDAGEPVHANTREWLHELSNQALNEI